MKGTFLGRIPWLKSQQPPLIYIYIFIIHSLNLSVKAEYILGYEMSNKHGCELNGLLVYNLNLQEIEHGWLNKLANLFLPF